MRGNPLGRSLFDFDPGRSVSHDVDGGMRLAPGGSNPVAFEVHNGFRCLVTDGTNYLLGSASPFAALSDLTGGVSIYVVAERTDAGSGAVSPMGINERGSASGANALHMGWNGLSGGASTLTALSANSAAATQSDVSDGVLGLNVVHSLSMHLTTTSRTAKTEGYGGASATATANDPADLDQIVIGAGLLYAAADASPLGHFTGRIYRVIVREGPFSQAIADYLANLYKPLRLPPMVSASDVIFAWDVRHSPFRDTRTGADISIDSGSPVVVSRAGDVAMFFTSADSDALKATLAAQEDIDGDFTIYAVAEHDGVANPYHVLAKFDQTADPSNENLFLGLRDDGAGIGAYWQWEEVGVAHLVLGNTVTVGKAHQVTATKSATTGNTYLDGVDGGVETESGVPRDIDRVLLGANSLGNYGSGYTYWLLAVRAARSAEVEAWITATFAPLKPWLPSSVDESDVLEVFDPNWSTTAMRKVSDNEDAELTVAGGVTREEDAAGLAFVRIADASASLQHTSPALAKLSDAGQVTCYMVGTHSGTTYLYASYYGGALNNQAMTSLIRNSTLAAGVVSWDTPTAHSDYSGATVAGDARTLATLAWDHDAETIEAFSDGVSNGSTASDVDPGNSINFTHMLIGNSGAADVTLSYMLWVAGPRDPAIEAEILARFPSGEDMS